MLEARLAEASILKRLLDAIKELVTDANFECNEEGIVLQAMDNSHVALVSVKLDASGFKRYRCDRPLPLGVNLNSFTKVLKCAKDDDVCILKAADDADVLSLTYEARNSDRIAEYEMKLMDIDADTLQIPDTEYEARVTMPSAEFSRIVRDLSQLGESVRIEVTKEGVRFISDGEAANGNILLKQSEGAAHAGASSKREEDEDEEAEDEEDEGERKQKRKTKAKKEKVKKEDGAEDEDDGEFKAKPENEGDEDEDEDDEALSKKRKKPTNNGKPAKKAKKGADDVPEGAVRIEMNQHVNLTFSLKYLVNFSKSASLASSVQLMMSNDVPLLVSYDFDTGYIRYYLAPKIGDD
ncbi:proliferating cell nuclear antigen [Laetiporus sulphureus 93-53]|uniref:DNA sliding clamp PCNA n=1 Tax=Laetiporus sulphureus 93-53 TaxID=1314785 RepID=A0A165DV68_9APHY|nr:proliferating cell nuclear antigen [Laetiporus sulphureus 93-53]KZT05691.1 proliferating cell nuclear antigen [Laetiporus sulphureus 93-53]